MSEYYCPACFGTHAEGPQHCPASSAPLPTLAELCYRHRDHDDELFAKLNNILGCDIGDCLKPGFVFQCTDSWVDGYDGSVEVIRPDGSQWMTREQADAILALGFGMIYESVGEEARVWYGGRCEKGTPREGSEDMQIRAKNRTLERRVAVLRDALDGLVKEQDDRDWGIRPPSGTDATLAARAALAATEKPND
jgi:hypothetical protein